MTGEEKDQQSTKLCKETYLHLHLMTDELLMRHCAYRSEGLAMRAMPHRGVPQDLDVVGEMNVF